MPGKCKIPLDSQAVIRCQFEREQDKCTYTYHGNPHFPSFVEVITYIFGGLKPSFFMVPRGPRLRSTQLLIQKTSSNLTFAYFLQMPGAKKPPRSPSSLLCWTERFFFWSYRLCWVVVFSPPSVVRVAVFIKKWEALELTNWARWTCSHKSWIPGRIWGAANSEIWSRRCCFLDLFLLSFLFCVHFFFEQQKLWARYRGNCWIAAEDFVWEIIVSEISWHKSEPNTSGFGVQGSEYKSWFQNIHSLKLTYFLLSLKNRGPFLPPKRKGTRHFWSINFRVARMQRRGHTGKRTSSPWSLFGAAPFETPEKMGLIKALGVVKGKMWRNSKTNLVVKPDLTRFPLLRGSLNC